MSVVRHLRRRPAARWPSELPERATVVFDGWCGFCTRAVRLLGAVDRHHRLTLVAAQEPGVSATLGLTTAETAAAAWVLTPDGARLAGAPAIGTALAVALGTRLVLAPWRVPGFGRVADRAYAWVAANRHRLRGDEPWCARRPQRCQGEGQGQGAACGRRF